MKNTKRNKILKFILFILFGMYLFILLYLTILKRLYYGTVTGLLLENYKVNYEIYYRNSINIIPLRTIYSYLIHPPSEKIALTNIFGNILAFVPMGFLVPAISMRFRSLYKVFMVSIGTSISIEIIQLILRIGSTDIDDLILNTLGGLFGYLILFIVMKFISRDKASGRAIDRMS